VLCAHRDDLVDLVLLDWLTAQTERPPRIGWKINVESRHTILTCIPKILNHNYPELFKTANSPISYVSQADIARNCGYSILGVPWMATAAEITAILGAPTYKIGEGWVDPPTIPVWVREVDSSAEVELVLKHDGTELFVCVRVKAAESVNSVPAAVLGVFVAWACEQNLLDPAAFADHTDLYNMVRMRQAQGSELASAAMPRGFWTSHLVDRPAFRQRTTAWFSAFWDHYIVRDFIAVFGERAGEFGHMEPDIDTDTWDVVDRATPIIATRLGVALM
jgi:hypothetical protein